MRTLLAIGLALIPMLLVAFVAAVTGYTDAPNAIAAVVCTALLLAFAAYRWRSA